MGRWNAAFHSVEVGRVVLPASGCRWAALTWQALRTLPGPCGWHLGWSLMTHALLSECQQSPRWMCSAIYRSTSIFSSLATCRAAAPGSSGVRDEGSFEAGVGALAGCGVDLQGPPVPLVTESVHAMKQVRMKKLEQIRLEVDSRRRTVLDLSMKVSSLPLSVSARLLSCTSEPLCACLGPRPLQVLFNAYVNIAV